MSQPNYDDAKQYKNAEDITFSDTYSNNSRLIDLAEIDLERETEGKRNEI